MFKGTVWSFADDQVLQIDFVMTQTGSECVFRTRASLDYSEP